MPADPAEIAKFDALANDWWNPLGAMKPLHQLNPLRLQVIQNQVTLQQKKVLDIGCGGGLLSEAMAGRDALVTGIDLSEQLIKLARQHAQEQELTIDYHFIDSAAFSKSHPAAFDMVTCMELLEHVPEPEQLVQECATLVKPEARVFCDIKPQPAIFFKSDYRRGIFTAITAKRHASIRAIYPAFRINPVGVQIRPGFKGISGDCL